MRKTAIITVVLICGLAMHPVIAEEGRQLRTLAEGQVWPDDLPLRAGVSAMGFGGINTHVTLESCDPPASRLRPSLDEHALLASSQETEVFVLYRDLRTYGFREQYYGEARSKGVRFMQYDVEKKPVVRGGLYSDELVFRDVDEVIESILAFRALGKTEAIGLRGFDKVLLA